MVFIYEGTTMEDAKLVCRTLSPIFPEDFFFTEETGKYYYAHSSIEEHPHTYPPDARAVLVQEITQAEYEARELAPFQPRQSVEHQMRVNDQMFQNRNGIIVAEGKTIQQTIKDHRITMYIVESEVEWQNVLARFDLYQDKKRFAEGDKLDFKEPIVNGIEKVKIFKLHETEIHGLEVFAKPIAQSEPRQM